MSTTTAPAKAALPNEGRPGYKPTKLGWIPEEWEVKTLGELGWFTKGKGLTKAELTEEGIPCVTYGDLYTKHHIHIKEFNSFTTPEAALQSKRIEKNDILFAGSGETAEEIGKCAAFTGNEEAYAGGDVVIFRQQKIDAGFLSLVLNSPSLIRQRARLGQGNSVVHIYRDQLAQQLLPLPPKAERDGISSILGAWDRAIATVQQLITAQEKRKQGLMQQLLSGKKRFKGFDGEWKEVRLGELARVDTRSLASSTPQGYTFRYISLSDVEPGRINTELPELQFGNAPSRARRVVQQGDILLSTVRPNLQGFARITDSIIDTIASTGFAVLSPTKSVNGDYLYQYLFTPHVTAQISGLIAGSNYPSISSEDVKRLKVLIPEQAEQDRIASLLTSIEHEIHALHAKFTLLTEQKRGLMQVLLTGERRLKDEITATKGSDPSSGPQ